MSQQYTPEQLKYLAEYEISFSVNASFLPDKALLIDLLILLENEGKDYGINNVSALFREAVRCLLHHGLDWRNGQIANDGNVKLDEILTLLKNGNFVTGDNERVQGKSEFEGIDDSETFFTE